MQMTLVLYESKYGFTEMIARNLSLILGPAKYCRTSEFKGDGNSYETIVLCTPVYLEFADINMIDYVTKNSDWIKKKKVILIVTCLAENMVDHYFKPFHDILGESILLHAPIGGQLILNKLINEDCSRMKQFCNKTGLTLKDYNLFDMYQFTELAINIKEIKDKNKKPVDQQELLQIIVDFISNHNTCTLATGQGSNIRATPIEYIYKNNYFYLLSEGGEKFANLLLNPYVSICIYDSYKSMSELAGLQITGTSEIIDINCDEYNTVLTYKGLNSSKILSLPVALNLLKISISKIEFLWSGFCKSGYDVKQIMLLP